MLPFTVLRVKSLPTGSEPTDIRAGRNSQLIEEKYSKCREDDAVDAFEAAGSRPNSNARADIGKRGGAERYQARHRPRNMPEVRVHHRSGHSEHRRDGQRTRK